MDFKKRLLSGIAFNTMGNISNQLITLVISVLLARFLGPEKLGTYYLLLSLPIILNSFASLGHVQSLNRFLPELKGVNKLYLIRQLLKQVMTIKLFIIFIISVLFIVFYPKIFSLMGLGLYQNPFILFFLLTYFILMNLNSVLNVLMIVNMEQRKLNILNVSLTIILLVVILILIQVNWLQITIMIAILPGLEVIKFIYLLFNYSVPGKALKESYVPEYQKLVHRFNKYTIIMYLIQLSGMILAYRSDIYFIGYFMTGSAVAFYMIATNLTTQAYSLIGTRNTGQMILAAMVKSFIQHGPSGLKKYFQYHITFTALHSFPIMIGGLIIAPGLISILYGKEYAPVNGLLMAALIFHGFLKFGGAISAVLVAMEKPQYFLWTKILIIINISLNIILIPRMGVVVAIIATGVSKLIILSVEITLTRRLIDLSFPFNSVFKIFIASLIMGITVYFPGQMIHEPVPKILIQLFIGLLIYPIIITRLNIINQDIQNFFPKTIQSVINKIKIL